jgi:hypothetical protein
MVTSTYIIIFQVSTGKSASLKDQSNFVSATGSSVGSWYGATYSWARASPAGIRFRGSKTSIRSRRSTAGRVSKYVDEGFKGTFTHRIRVPEFVG